MSITYLTHSAKGQTWGHHKYIAIKNGRYIYPEDVQRSQDLKNAKATKREEDWDTAERNINNERVNNGLNDKRIYDKYNQKGNDAHYQSRQYEKAAGVAERKGDLKSAVEYRKKAKELERTRNVSYNTASLAQTRAASRLKRTMTAPENKIIRKGQQSEAALNKNIDSAIAKNDRLHSVSSGKRNNDPNELHRASWVEGGNIPNGGVSEKERKQRAKNGFYTDRNVRIYRQSDVNETKNKTNAVKNNIERTVKNASNKATEFADKVKEEIFDKGKSVAEVAKKYGTKGKELILSLFKRN